MSATAGLFLTGAQTYSSFRSQQAQADAVKAQGAYEARGYTVDAKIAELQAKDAVQRGDIQAGMRGAQANQEIGGERANVAAHGLQTGVGSEAEVEANVSGLSTIDQAMIRANAAREAWGYKVQAGDYLQRADLARRSAELTAQGIGVDEMSTLLGGVAKTYGIYRANQGNFALSDTWDRWRVRNLKPIGDWTKGLPASEGWMP